MLDRVRTNIDLLGYAMLFFPEQHPGLARIIEDKRVHGLRVRIALADPECAEVAARDALEGLGGTLPARIRSSLAHLGPLFANTGVEIRFHRVPLYNAMYRFDDQMLITPYLYKLHAWHSRLAIVRSPSEWDALITITTWTRHGPHAIPFRDRLVRAHAARRRHTSRRCADPP